MLTHAQTAALLEQADNTPGARSLALLTIENSRMIGELMLAVQKMVDGQTLAQLEFTQHRVEFKDHVRDEGSLLSAGIKIFALIVSLLAGVISIGGWYVGHHVLAVNESQQANIDKNNNRITALEAEAIVRKASEAAK